MLQGHISQHLLPNTFNKLRIVGGVLIALHSETKEISPRGQIDVPRIPPGPVSICTRDALKAASAIKDFQNADLWPIDAYEYSFSPVLDNHLESLQDSDIEESLGLIETFDPGCLACRFRTTAAIELLRESIEKEAAGLRLDCAQNGCKKSDDRECRISHK